MSSRLLIHRTRLSILVSTQSQSNLIRSNRNSNSNGGEGNDSGSHTFHLKIILLRNIQQVVSRGNLVRVLLSLLVYERHMQSSTNRRLSVSFFLVHAPYPSIHI